MTLTERIGPSDTCWIRLDHADTRRAWAQVSGRGDSHPPALAEPGVRVSPHRAPTGRPGVRAIRCQWTKRLGWR